MFTSQMLLVLLQAALQLVGDFSNNASITAAVNLIKEYEPAIAQAEPIVVKGFQDILADLTGSGVLTDAQMTDMLTAKATMDARVDADTAAILGPNAGSPPAGAST